MPDKDRVFALFSLFSDLEGEAAERYRPLCDGAAAAMASRMRPGITEEADLERLCMAAAAGAYCDLLELRGSSAAEELRVGDITLKNSSRSGSGDSEGVRAHFEALAADLLEPACVLRRTGEVGP